MHDTTRRNGYTSVEVPRDAADVFKRAVRRHRPYHAPKIPSWTIQRLLETLRAVESEHADVVAEHGGVWMRLLARAGDLDPGNTLRQADLLAQMGWVTVWDEQTRDVRDRRGGRNMKFITLTDEGRRYLDLCGGTLT